MNIGKRLCTRPIGLNPMIWQGVGSSRKMHAISQLTHQHTSFPSSQWLQDCIHRSSLSSIFTFATIRPFARLSMGNASVELDDPIQREIGNVIVKDVCDNHIWQSSTMKKRRAKMNKHKIKKRKKDLKMNTKSSRA